jgi:uncharacterized protein (TIGR03435 family)
LSQTTPIRYIAEWAYGARSFQFIGKWPSWAEYPGYFIEAKAPVAMNEEECKAMVRVLLADSFKLSLRPEKRSMNVYALVVGSKRPALRQVGAEGADKSAAANDEDWATFCDAASPHLGRCFKIFGHDGPTPGITMEDLAHALSGLYGLAKVDGEVVDHTGLTGRYAFKLKYDSSPDGVGDDVVSALDRQLGLKLVRKNEPVDVFEFVRVERPQIQ